MGEVTIRELRNHGGEVLERVARGEALTVTRDGQAIAELRPLRRRPIPSAVLVKRWRGLPAVDAVKLKTDIDNLLDQSLCRHLSPRTYAVCWTPAPSSCCLGC